MSAHILLIEDDEFMRESLHMELEAAGYRVTVAADGRQALGLAQEDCFDLVVSDVRMPGIDGLEALSAIREHQPMARNILITGYASPDAPVKALKMRVDDYLMKPFSSEEFLASVRSSLDRYLESVQTVRSPEQVREHFLRLVTGILYESRFPRWAGHSERVAQLCLRLARRLGFSAQRCRRLYLAALLHGIGKAELPHHLLEEGELDQPELERSHPQLARELLQPFSALKGVATLILHQHERWDGTGSPRGLKQEQIPLESRILAATARLGQLQQKLPLEKAMLRLAVDAGKAYDPRVVELLTQLAGAQAARVPLPQPEPGRAAALLNLAGAYRASGQFEVAATAYDRALELLTSEQPELRLQVLEGRASLLAAQGHREESYEALEAAFASARQGELDFPAARLVLRLAGAWVASHPERFRLDDLSQASQTLAVWEASFELCQASLLLATAASMGVPGAPGFEENLAAFLTLAARGAFQAEVLAAQPAAARHALAFALEHGDLEGETRDFLAHTGAAGVELLEGLLGDGTVELRLKVLDLLAALPGKEARALLARLSAREGGIVSRKSSMLLSRDRAEGPPLLQVHFLGGFRVAAGETVLDDEAWPTRKVRSLFGYLASRRGEPVDEEKLMDLFWEQGGKKARHSLHNSVSQIRRTLAGLLGAPAGKRSIKKKRQGYLFGKEVDCWIDLEEFEERIHDGKSRATVGRWEEALKELRKAERLYRGDFLEGCNEDWKEDLRLRALGHLLEALTLQAGYFFEKGKFEVSADYWSKVLARDNCHEDAYLGLMLCQARRERQSEAIKVYHRCTQALKQELNLGPPPRIAEAYLKIVAGETV